MGRLIIYEGSDEEIRKYLSSLPQQSAPAQPPQNGSSAPPSGKSSTQFDAIAQAFRKRLDEAAAQGRKGQKEAILAWLRRDGVIDLTDLWKASLVKNQHDYGGIGSSLTRNMRKVGGMKQWYTYEPHPTKSGEWQYKIVPELIDPLKTAFGV